MPTVSKLDRKPAELSPFEARRAIEERRARASELLERDDSDLSASEVDELRRLNDEIQALENHHEPDPAHRMRHGGGRSTGIDKDTAVLAADQSYAEWARVQGVVAQARSGERPS